MEMLVAPSLFANQRGNQDANRDDDRDGSSEQTMNTLVSRMPQIGPPERS